MFKIILIIYKHILLFTSTANKVIDEPERQKKDVSNAIFLQGKDQFRQRMAWALAQILVVTPKQVK